LSEFFSGFKQTVLKPGEVIEWIAVDAQDQQGIFTGFDKVARRASTDISVVNCASFFRVSSRIANEVRLALGGATPIPVRLYSLENALQGLLLTTDITDLIDEHLPHLIHPLSDVRGSAAYRRVLARQLVLTQWLNAGALA
jgi:xanthine dehydrogenase small subunit